MIYIDDDGKSMNQKDKFLIVSLSLFGLPTYSKGSEPTMQMP